MTDDPRDGRGPFGYFPFFSSENKKEMQTCQPVCTLISLMVDMWNLGLIPF